MLRPRPGLLRIQDVRAVRSETEGETSREEETYRVV
jgi:hypothetical protein